jgi:2-polyprenyl-6-methoxyphenol hydroxylase-like FAD-dependent oxidoreductase
MQSGMDQNKTQSVALRVAVIGASIGGLSVANVLHRLGAYVQVLESFPYGFQERGGALGAVDAGLLARIRGENRAMQTRSIRSHGHFYGDLWRYLFEGLLENSVRFGFDVTEIRDPLSNEPQVMINGENHAFDLVIGADGGKSTIRTHVTNKVPEYAGYTVWRGLVPTAGIAGPPSGSRTVRGIRYETLGFPFTNGRGEQVWNCGIYMMMPESEVAAPSRNRQVVTTDANGVPEWFLPVVSALFGARNAKFWEACTTQGNVNSHPVWEFSADTVVNNRIALLGDAAHMASPRTGAGAYTAMVDAVSLGAAVQRTSNIDDALRLYNDDTVSRGRDLFQKSRRAATYFAPPGVTPLSPPRLLEIMGDQLRFDA